MPGPRSDVRPNCEQGPHPRVRGQVSGRWCCAAMAVIVGSSIPWSSPGSGGSFFHHKASGSLIVQDGKVVGSELIGQPFSDPGYFWSRPSATSPFPYNGAASAGSNLGPPTPPFSRPCRPHRRPARGRPRQHRAGSDRSGHRFRQRPRPRHQPGGGGVPGGAGGPGARVVRQTRCGLSSQKHTKGRQLGFLGEPRVNVLELNLALDALAK